jgi:hypothetical protein
MLRTHPRSFLEEVTAGTTLGLCVQVFLTWLLTPLGVERAASTWIVAVVGACLVHPRLQSLWRSQARSTETPTWVGWALSAVSVTACWWVANNDWPGHPIEQIPGKPGQWFTVASQVDINFQQAISAMVLHGGTSFPNVAASPLQYELMVSYHIADAARWTGIDLTVLVARLQPFPVLILAVLLCALIAYRITKSPAGAVLGAAFAYFTNPPPLWEDTRNPLINVGSLNLGLSRSATYSFGQPILLLAILIVFVVISHKRLKIPPLLAFGLVAFVAAGAKATLVPQLICALLAVLVLGWILKATLSGRILVLIGLCGVILVAALYFVLGTESRDLTPSLDVTATHWTAFALLLRPADALYLGIPKAAFLTVGWLLGVSAAAVAIIVKRRSLKVWFLTAIGVSGLGGTLLTAHPSLSQIWFLRTAWPLMGVLAGIGVYEASKALRLRRRARVGTVTTALVLGLAAAALVRLRFHVPTTYQFQKTWAVLFAPYVMLIGLCLLVGVVVVFSITRAMKRHFPVKQMLVVGLIISLVALQGSGFLELANKGLYPLAQTAHFPKVDAQGAYVARWVREHSATQDVLATNMHCVQEPERPVDGICDTQHFWLAALAERQVLLEGWAYAPAPPGVDPEFIPSVGRSRVWDPQFLNENDASITHPTRRIMNWLRDQDVRWIVVDRSVSHESTKLQNYADLELVKGHFAVYRVTSTDTSE